MTRLRRPGLPDSILGRTIALASGMVLLLTAINVGIIFLNPLPRDLPLSAYEVARLLEGLRIAKITSGVDAQATAMDVRPATRIDRLIGRSIAHHLGVPPSAVRFRRTTALPERLTQFDRQIGEEARLYPADTFDPVIFTDFEVSARLRDGSVRSLVRRGRDPGLSWQLGTALRLVVAFLLVLPIAWWFARQLASPIRDFASAADRVGREPGLAPAAVRGPSEIRLAATAINDMQERLHRYLAERTGVVGAIAHDLRTPLARLRFHLVDVSDEVRCRAEAEIAEMEAMIRATMEFVQHETRPKLSEPIDLALLVEGLVDDFTDLGRPVRLERADAATVRGDPLLLKRLFANLLGNAVAYGREASVWVAVADKQAKVTIADQGPGMSDHEIARAFEPFYRAEASRNRQTGGIGLGLAIVRGAARAHGGEVTLANGRAGGLIATVLLPVV